MDTEIQNETAQRPDTEPEYVFRASRWSESKGRVEYAREYGKRAFKIPKREDYQPKDRADRVNARQKKPRAPRGRKPPKK